MICKFDDLEDNLEALFSSMFAGQNVRIVGVSSSKLLFLHICACVSVWLCSFRR